MMRLVESSGSSNRRELKRSCKMKLRGGPESLNHLRVNINNITGTALSLLKFSECLRLLKTRCILSASHLYSVTKNRWSKEPLQRICVSKSYRARALLSGQDEVQVPISLRAAKRCLVMPLGAKLDERKVHSKL